MTRKPRKPVSPPADAPEAPHPNRRREMWFLGIFLALLIGGFTLIALKPVNDHVIEPFTAGIAKVSGVTLNLLGQEVVRTGTILRSPRFAVNIKNGCNGVETVLIFVAAVLAFPAPWKSRLLGLGLGILAIQALNLVRVVALFLTGAYFPAFFDSSHTVVWQAIVVLFGVLLWIFWARRYATTGPPPPTAAAAAS